MHNFFCFLIIFMFCYSKADSLNDPLVKYIGNIKISYPEGREVTVARGTSILEASRLAKIPHQSVCGGKARCTTCRVRVISYDGPLPAPNAYETMAIKKGGLEDGVRLACQLHPTSNIKIMPLVNPTNVLERNSSLDGLSKPKALSGKELETVILFIDLREFTKLSEKKFDLTCRQKNSN